MALSPGVVACIACERNLVTFSNVLFSCAAYPFTVSTRLGIRAWRRFSCTSISDQAVSVRTRNWTRLLYIPISTNAVITRIARMTQAMYLSPEARMENQADGTTAGNQVQSKAAAV